MDEGPDYKTLAHLFIELTRRAEAKRLAELNPEKKEKG